MSASINAQHERESFRGFEPITANFLYCPNQFFDLCLPNHSRGAVRLIAYMLRKTLGWLDDDGNPIEQNIDVSYQELIKRAGISRAMIRSAIDEALAGNFIQLIQNGRPNSEGVTAQTAVYALRWDDLTAPYVSDATAFKGFYAGDGHRTAIPNSFFDDIVPTESLAVIKIVGAVLRHTVGYQNQFGGRRSDAPLSYTYLHKYANIKGTRTLAQAIRHTLDAGYIRRVHAGCFDAEEGNRCAARYAVNWRINPAFQGNGLKKKAGERFEKESRGTVRKGKQQRFEVDSGNGLKKKAGKRFEKEPKEKTNPNNTFKQQQQPVAVENAESYRLLRQAGFDERIAHALSSLAVDQIKRQIAWLEFRNVRDNKLGMLRRAIEEDWSQPPEAQQHEKQGQLRERDHQRRSEEAQEQAYLNAQKKARFAHRDQLLDRWRGLPNAERIRYQQMAVDQANSDFDRLRLRKNQDLQNPLYQVLLVMEAELTVAVGD